MQTQAQNLRQRIHDLLHSQLCAWELLTMAADSAVGNESETLRTHAVMKRVLVRELYDLLRRSEPRGKCNVPVESCPPLPRDQSLPALLGSLECHEAGTLHAYGEALRRAGRGEAEVLA